MADYTKKYVREQFQNISGTLDTLLQCLQIVSDGDLISKPDRDTYVKNGLIHRTNGYNIITTKGIKYLSEIGIIWP